MELISIIIPVYNTEKYITDCLDSILQQTYKDLEIIIVDDGSTDCSFSLCKDYAEKDVRIVLMQKENGGQGEARNYALRYCKGTFVAFIDSDDVIAPDYIERLYQAIHQYQADIACCGGVKFKSCLPKDIGRYTSNIRVYSNAEAIENFCLQGEINASPWGKLVPAEIVCACPFPVGTGYEDFATVYKWYDKAKKIVYLDINTYFYRQLDSSTMHTKFNAKKLDRMKVADEMSEFVNKNYPELNAAMETRVFLANIQTLMWLPMTKEYAAVYDEINRNIKRTRGTVIRNKKAKKVHKIMAGMSHLGIYVLRVLGGIYRHLFS